MMKGLLGPQEAQSEIHNGKNFGKKKKSLGLSLPALQSALTGTGYLNALVPTLMVMKFLVAKKH